MFLSVCLISCGLLEWVEAALWPPSSSFLAFKFTVSGQSKSSVGSQRGCESGVKLKKHTQWDRRWGMTTFSEGKSTRNTRTEKHTYKRSVCKCTSAHFQRARGMSFSAHGTAFLLSQHFLCAAAAEGGAFVM